MKHIIKSLEAFHDMQDRPVFDHYWVICPSVDYPHTTYDLSGAGTTKHYLIFNDENKVQGFKSQEKAYNALDFMLTNNGSMNPVLLGEMNGKCYFISYWN